MEQGEYRRVKEADRGRACHPASEFGIMTNFGIRLKSRRISVMMKFTRRLDDMHVFI